MKNLKKITGIFLTLIIAFGVTPVFAEEVITDNKITFSEVFSAREEAEKVRKQKEEEYKKGGYCDIKSEIFDKTIVKKHQPTYEYEKPIYYYNNVKVYEKPNKAAIESEGKEKVSDYGIVEATITKGEPEKDGDVVTFEFKGNCESLKGILPENAKVISCTTKTETISLEEKSFSSFEEAEEYLEEFVNENKEYTIIKNGPTEILDESNIITTTNSYEFGKLIDAVIKKQELEALSTALERHEVKIETIDKEAVLKDKGPIPEKTFETEEAANEYINSYIKKYGKENVTNEITKITEEYEGTGEVTTVKKIDSLNKEYFIPSSNNFVLIKQAKLGTVAVWTETAMTDIQKIEFEESYAKLASSIDGSTAGKLNIEYISGLGVHNLSYLGNGWGTDYGFTKDIEGNIILTIPSKKVSHIVYGVADLTNEKNLYKVTGTWKLYEIIKIYKVSDTITTYGYGFVASATGIKEVQRLSYQKYKSTWLINAYTKEMIYKDIIEPAFELNISAIKKVEQTLENEENSKYKNSKIKYLSNIESTPSDIIYTGDNESHIAETVLIASVITLVGSIVFRKKIFE